MPGALDIYVENRANFRASRTYQLQSLLPRLRDAGVSVRILDRPAPPGDVEAAFFHIDLTDVPEHFREAAGAYRRTINGNATSIHRHLYSTLRLQPGEGHAGPVIVKTVLNAHGRPELRLRQHRNLWTRAGHALHKIVDPGFKLRAAPRYRVYPSLADVPPDVWDDSRLMVERFAFPTLALPIVKYRYIFLGEVELILRQSFDDLQCSGKKLLTNEHVEEAAPEAVMAIRRRLHLDYGSMDYFIVDGRPVVVDANKTYSANPNWAQRFPFRKAYSDRVAERLIAFAHGAGLQG